MKIAPDILNLVPYSPGKPIDETKREYGLSDVIKLASNENPLGPSPKVIDAVSKGLTELHRYPDSAAYELTRALSQHLKVDTNWLVLGNGSNELSDLLIRIYCEPGDSIVTSQGAFLAYKICAQAARVKTVEIPLNSEMGFDMEAMTQYCIKKWDSRHKLLFIANPNNPTGTYINETSLRRLLNAVAGREDLLVVLDEAYFDYVRAHDFVDGLRLLRNYPNLILQRTFSKSYGLAGLRIGYVIARPEVIELIQRVRNPFNVNSLAQIAARAALQDQEHYRRSKEIVWQGLDYFYGELKKLGLPFVPSQANFILFDTMRDAAKIDKEMLKRGVILRPVKNYGFPNHLRMTVGLPDENVKAIDTLAESISLVPSLR